MSAQPAPHRINRLVSAFNSWKRRNGCRIQDFSARMISAALQFRAQLATAVPYLYITFRKSREAVVDPILNKNGNEGKSMRLTIIVNTLATVAIYTNYSRFRIIFLVGFFGFRGDSISIRSIPDDMTQWMGSV